MPELEYFFASFVTLEKWGSLSLVGLVTCLDSFNAFIFVFIIKLLVAWRTVLR